MTLVGTLRHLGLDPGSTTVRRALVTRGFVVTESTVRRDLEWLAGAQRLEKSGTGAGTRWRLRETERPPIDLRFGRWEDAMPAATVDHLIVDTPYSEKCHSGHNAMATVEELERRELAYEAWDEEDVAAFVRSWAPRTRGWFCAHTDHVLLPAWEAELERAGRYVFAPIPCVAWGSRCRIRGDGPSSISYQLLVARPRRGTFPCGTPYDRWGTLPGAYVTGRGSRSAVVGGKPLAMMEQIVRDYTRPGELVGDPCFGGGTTAVACDRLGRRFVGSEARRFAFDAAVDRLAEGR